MPQEKITIESMATGTEGSERSPGPRDDRYNAQQIEEKWFARWQQDASLYAAEKNSTKPKYYVLEMLPYP